MRLDLTHFEAVRALLLENQPRTINGYNFEKGLDWIQKTFLSQIPNHFIYGSFDGEQLVSITCLVTHFPRPGWAYVGNVFYKPKYTNEKLKVSASAEAYEKAVEVDCPTVVSCVLEKRFRSQWNLVTRYSETFRKFDVEGLVKIPVGVYPKESWLQYVLGFHSCPEDCIIRKATFRKAG